jgi:hypothetical protein
MQAKPGNLQPELQSLYTDLFPRQSRFRSLEVGAAIEEIDILIQESLAQTVNVDVQRVFNSVEWFLKSPDCLHFHPATRR